ncbi:hypothetical protein [Stutzerimonas nitrititolerans]|uniref:hypothetical protein n=1 Tax=Stutzerimonas nitrititolerans TaxID=2482751 RepID=UPI00289D200D|nr:hypothetical protein [Stutzerimonas nitrititolerans]
MIFPLPEIDFTRPLYLYGAGMMGVSYKRQIEQLGMQDLLKAFIVDRPAMESYLGVPVIKRSALTEQQLRDSQFLIASDRLVKVFDDNLIQQGCAKENIIYPLLAWNGRSVIDGIKGDKKACIYPIVSSYEDLSLLYSKVNKKRKLLAGRGISLNVTVVVDTAINFSASEYPEVELVTADSKEEYPNELLDKNDIVVILNVSDLASIDVVYHDKVYLYGIALLGRLAGDSKKKLAKEYEKKHQVLLKAARSKEKVRVVFLAIHKSVWKVDQVVKRMLVDPFFEPLILICPYTAYGEDRMWQDMDEVGEFFAAKGFPVLSSYNKQERRWISLFELSPDIVFFTNSHKITRKEYYDDAYSNYLSCYVPYYTDIASGYDVNDAYNKVFHNVVWKIFHADENAVSRAVKYSANKGANVFLSGSPFLESFFVESDACLSPWGKQASGKKRIIYAPHQAITNENNLHLSTFLHVADLMRELAIKYRDELEWAFRPHTILKSKLYEHADWGRERTDEYYSFWSDFESSRLDDGDYIELFKASDAIIHDCGSFILEYLLVEKPCAYLYLNGPHQLNPVNDYGKRLLNYYRVVDVLSDIESFVLDVISGSAQLKEGHQEFIENELRPLYVNATPSICVIQALKASIWGIDNG